MLESLKLFLRGYPEDARNHHPKLRGPVDPLELEVDPRTGMKNYIANEDGHWDTSKALVRRTLEQCIVYGRRYRANGNKQDHHEAYRLLGTGMFSKITRKILFMRLYSAAHDGRLSCTFQFLRTRTH
jgi:hypothetical protein